MAFNLLGRLVLGIWFVLAGALNWARFDPAPMASGRSFELSHAFAQSGLTGCASIALIGAGVLLMSNRLSIVALMSGVSVFVAAGYWAILTGRPAPVAVVAATLLFAGALLFQYRSYYDQLFRARALDTLQAGEEPDVVIRRVTVASRYLWGGWWVISGLFHFFLGPLIGTSTLAVQVILALLHTGMYEVVKGVEAIGGLAVLTRRWAPLLLVVNIPITVVVVYWDVILQEPGNPIGVGVGMLTVTTTLLVLRAYRADLAPLATWKPEPLLPLLAGRSRDCSPVDTFPAIGKARP